MIAKLASVLALSILVLGVTAARAQTASSDARIGRPYPFPAPGSFTGHVLTRAFRPVPIPMATTNDQAPAQPAIAPAPGSLMMPPFNQPVSGANVQLSWSPPIYYRGGRAVMRHMPSRNWNTTTGSDGSFALYGLPQGTFKYVVRQAEFAPVSGSFTMSRSFGYTQDIFLKRNWNQVGSFSGRITVMPRWPIFAKTGGPIPASATAAADPAAEDATRDDGAGEPLSAEEAAADALTVPEAGATPPPAEADATANSPAGATAAIAPQALTKMINPIYLGRPLAGARIEVSTLFWGPYPVPMGATVSNANGSTSNLTQPAGTSMMIPPMRTWRAESDSNGNFGLKGLPAGRYSYRVTHRFFQPRAGTFSVGEFDPSVVRNIQLERRVRGTFAGVVGEGPRMLLSGAQPTGGASHILPFKFQPLAGARVVLTRSYRPFPRPYPLPLDGRAVVNATAPQAAAAATAPGEAAGGEDTALLKASESDAADAAPADDAADDAASSEAEIAAAAPADLRASGAGTSGGAPGMIAPPISIRPAWYRRATTDGNGRFRIARLPAGTYRYVVRAANHQPELGWFTISARQPRAFRRVLLPNRGPGPIDDGQISGRVMGYTIPLDVVYVAGGANPPAGGIRAPDRIVPLGGAHISYYIPPAPGMFAPQVMQVTTTDPDGNFSIRAPYGSSVTIHVSAKGYHDASQEISNKGPSELRTIYLKPQVVGNPPVKPVEAPTVSGDSVENPFSK